MKTFLHLTFTILTLFSASAQNTPIDFEENGNGADWVWTTFENDTNPSLEIISNPDPSGINTSSTVAKFTALQAGQPFAGCESLHGAGIGSFTIDESNSIIRIMVWKSVISDVGIKLVRADNWSLGEIKIPNTVINEWEQLEFNFASHIGNTYDQIVIFPDFSSRQSDNIIYFDNVYGDDAMMTSTRELEKTTIQLLPNPATNAITVYTNDAISRYEIYSMNGQLVDFNENIDNTTIDITNLPKGIYLFKAFNGNDVIIEKFIKE
ncbi:MAG: T9SS type A sorting domain-containing protein [Saprospiraceae bacterium]